MAKAPKDEWEKAMAFARDLDAELDHCHMTNEQLGAWVRHMNPQLLRTVFGYSVLVDNCCDPNATSLEWKPEIAAAMAAYKPAEPMTGGTNG